MFKPVVVNLESVRQAADPLPDATVNNVFKVFHGFYGNLFLSKFSTGIVENGDDQGIANARRIWAHGLRDFDAGVIKAALSQCMERHPEFPPSLPQFLALCVANRVREVFKTDRPALGMSGELRSRYAAQARAINERHAAKRVERATGFKELPPGLDGLKQAIANSIATAGGDEAAALTRMDRLFARKEAH